MTDVSTQQPQPTPGRRRQGRQQSRNSVQKAYMSENDAGVVDASHHAAATPTTPNRNGYASPPTNNNTTNNNNRSASAKQRAKNKSAHKQKNGASTSPEPDNNQQHHYHKQQATPQRASSAGLKGPSLAFAGATFHASPAPSALPMPSFFSRTSSSPSAPRDAVPIAQQPSPPATDTEVPSPYRPSPAANVKESPLDFMFRAHREERERQRSDAGPADHSASTPPAFSPFAAIAKATASPQGRPGPARRTSHGISTEELDGTSGQPTGPAFSTPYQDRIKAAKAAPNHASPAQKPQTQPPQYQYQSQYQQPSTSQGDDPTEALKKYLFGGSHRPASNSTPEAAIPRPAPFGANGQSPARMEYKTDGYHGHNNNNNIQAMENDLRRILKIDQGMDSSPVERRLFSK